MVRTDPTSYSTICVYTEKYIAMQDALNIKTMSAIDDSNSRQIETPAMGYLNQQGVAGVVK